jgi:hypothetical protein
MRSVLVTITIPEPMLRKIDQSARAELQSRSNFIRMCVVEHYGLKSQWELERDAPDPRKPRGRELWDAYDFQEEYEEAMRILEEEAEED